MQNEPTTLEMRRRDVLPVCIVSICCPSCVWSAELKLLPYWMELPSFFTLPLSLHTLPFLTLSICSPTLYAVFFGSPHYHFFSICLTLPASMSSLNLLMISALKIYKEIPEGYLNTHKIHSQLMLVKVGMLNQSNGGGVS